MRDLFAGRYLLLRLLGQGGMSKVWLARDLVGGVECALKQMLEPAGVTATDALRAEFLTLTRVRHPALVAVRELGLAPDGTPYITMDYVPGLPVDRSLERGDWAGLAMMAARAARGLEALEAAGVVHGDVKPSNLLVTPGARGRVRDVRLLDFGLASLLGSGRGHRGTAGFAAPEVVAGTPPRPESDLYGLGATLYQVAAGTPAFDAADPSSLLTRQRQGPPPARPLEEAGAPPALIEMILRLMAPDPGERPASAREARVELESLHPAARWPLAQRLGTETLVGRAALLAALDPAARTRSARITVVAGEAGSGKSALLREVAARDALAGRHVVAVSGLDAREPGAAAWSVLRRWFASSPAGSTALGAEIHGALAAHASAPAAGTLDSLLAAGMALLRGVIARHGAATILWDDASQTDELSLAWLRAMALRTPGASARWIWARRSAELVEDRFLFEAGLAESVHLEPLDREAVRQLAAARLGSEVPDPLVDFLKDSSGGNPGWMVALLEAAARRGALEENEDGFQVHPERLLEVRAPASLEAGLLEGIARLGSEARQLAAALAVWGGPLPGAAAADYMRGLPGPEIWEELRQARVAEPDSEARWALQPPALGRLIEEQLPAQERAALHARAGEWLASHDPDDWLGRFRHARAAGGDAEALRCAERALAGAGPEVAAPLAEQAAALAEQATAPAAGAPWWARAGQAHLDLGRSPQAVEDFRRALDGAPASADRHVWRQRLASALLKSDRLADAEAVIAGALDDDPPESVRAGLLTDRAMLSVLRGEPARAREIAAEALPLALQAGDPRSRGAAALTQGVAEQLLGHRDEAERLYIAAERAYREADDALGMARALMNRGQLAHKAGERGGEEHLKRVVRIARRGAAKPLAMESLVNLGMARMESGRWNEAARGFRRALRVALEQGRGPQAGSASLNLALLELLGGRFRAAARRLRPWARPEMAEHRAWFRPFAERLLAHYFRARGFRARALRWARRSAESAARRGSPDDRFWALNECALEWSARGNWAQALTTWEEALASRPSVPLGVLMVSLRRGRALLRTGRIDEAKKALNEARASLETRRWPYPEALALQLEAELALVEVRWPEARDAVEAALKAFRRLGAAHDRALCQMECVRLSRGAPPESATLILSWLEEAAGDFERMGAHADRSAALGLLVDMLRLRTAPPGGTRDLLTAVGEMLDSLLAPLELAAKAMRLAVEQMGAERGVLLLAEPSTNELRPFAEYGTVDSELLQKAVGYSRTVVERVRRSGGSLLVGDAPSDPRVASRSVLDLGVRSILCVPLFHAGGVIGTVYLEDRRRPDAFSESDRGLLEGFAHLMAMAITSSRGHDEVRQANERLLGENLSLRQAVAARFRASNVVAVSQEMQSVLSNVEQVALVDLTVLITGESGTGKDLLARVIHHGGPRRQRTFVTVNCGAMPETLLESELFGIEDDVATGVRGRPGKFEQAHGGTLFLDEIGEMPPRQQVALLSVIQNREVVRVGGRRPIPVDVRIVAATNQDLRSLIEIRRFREDLFYRLHIIPIEVPPLRTRKADIPALVTHFVQHYSARLGRPAPELSHDFVPVMMRSDWPGNVRELQNYIERLLAMNSGKVLRPQPAPPDLETPARGLHVKRGRKLSDAVGEVESQMIRQALESSAGNQSEAARVLGISEQAIRYKLRKYGLVSSRQKLRIR